MRKRNIEKKVSDAVSELEKCFSYNNMSIITQKNNALYHAERALCILCCIDDFEVENNYFELSERERKVNDFRKQSSLLEKEERIYTR